MSEFHPSRVLVTDSKVGPHIQTDNTGPIFVIKKN